MCVMYVGVMYVGVIYYDVYTVMCLYYLLTTKTPFSLYNRRGSILFITPRFGPNSLCTPTKQHSLRCRLQLVLVHYAFGISVLAIPQQYRSIFIPYCSTSHALFTQYHWISIFNGMECVTTRRANLFLLTRSNQTKKNNNNNNKAQQEQSTQNTIIYSNVIICLQN